MTVDGTGAVGVIGATGFIGGRLCARLEEEGRANLTAFFDSFNHSGIKTRMPL